MRRLVVPVLCAAALFAAGCTNDSLNLFEGEAGGPFLAEPHHPWDFATPTPGSTPVLDFGDGHDGELDVSGTDIVNECDRIEKVENGTQVRTSPAAYSVGDRVLLWQTQDTFATEGAAAVVTTASMALAGAWQMARVTALGGNFIKVDVALLPYETKDERSAQACRVPEFTTVTIPGGERIQASTWSAADGGGVVAFFATGTVTVDGTISAGGQGYEGGNAHTGLATGGNVTTLQTSAGDGGRKGAGLDGRSETLYGRGNWANAAGGGNAHSGGGAGGGNAGAGGLGGKQWSDSDTSDNPDTAGMAGAAVGATYPARLVMGGGGGELQCHHGTCGDAGDGGGIVLLFASTLAGTGTISADGDDAAASIDDAGSGGGAGGTIVVLTGASTFSGEILATGGDGADAVWDDIPTDKTGPGGGGGGGHIVLVTSTAGMTVSVAPGVNGVNPLAGNDAWGATPGQPGVVDAPGN